MANYCATWRSNYFQVKDQDAFEEAASTWPDTRVVTRDVDGEDTLFAIMEDERGDQGGMPSGRYNDETGDYEELDLLQELSEHLPEGEVAILMESGHEKLRYVCGHALAVNHEGEVLHVSLDDIYDKAFEAWGIKPSEASY